MSKFKVGDYVRRTNPEENKGVKLRHVVRIDGSVVWFLREELNPGAPCHGRVFNVLEDMLELDPAFPDPRETFRAVFCAWTGQSPTKPTATPLQQAKRALYTYLQISYSERLGELVDRIVETAKAEALARVAP